MLNMAQGQRRIAGRHLEFRDAISASMFTPGGVTPPGSIVFDICVSDYARERGVQGLSTVTVADWQRIGTLRFTEAICSYNGDHVIQFHHPRWRDDRNDAATYVRQREERVRR